jgi:short-chain fatty acids transporter
MLERLSTALTRWCVRYIPDGYVIAVALTALILMIAVFISEQPPLAMITAWGDGFWGFIPFTLQMSMVVLTGFIVADAPLLRQGLIRLAAVPSTPRGAIALTAIISMGLGFINWGLSIVASAILARHIGARKIGADFRLLVASAYLGLGCMWHSGLSASAPLTSSDPAQNFVKNYLGGPVPVTDTVFSGFNLGLALIVMFVMTMAAVWMQPRASSPDNALSPETVEEEEEPPLAPAETPAARLERSPAVNLFLAACVAVYVPQFLMRDGIAKLNINHVNLIFFGVGALLHYRPASLLRSAERGGKYVWGVLLQFGLYAAVAGVIDKSGIAAGIAGFFSRAASPETFPLMVVWYSGILNYLVPSGGAKWFIEVQYVAEAAKTIGVPMPKAIVSYAWGDMLTDIIQPFWAIPLLAMAKLGFRDIMGYCLTLFLVYAALVSAAFLVYGYYF